MAGTHPAEHLPVRRFDSHKHQNGRVLVVAGSDDMPGAAALAVRGALRAGAGTVTLCSTDRAGAIAASLIPEALHRSRDDWRTGLDRWDSAVFGPGLSRTEAVAEWIRSFWAEVRCPAVLDADALYFLAKGIPAPQGPCVLTPHEGELALMLGSEPTVIRENRDGAAQTAADRLGKTVVLKGPSTLVATTGLPIDRNETGNAGMATGGMGDVLSGVIGTLLAQGLGPHEAAMCATHWHGLAADLCAEEVGGVGYLASEVADRLPAARSRMLGSLRTNAGGGSSLA